LVKKGTLIERGREKGYALIFILPLLARLAKNG